MSSGLNNLSRTETSVKRAGLPRQLFNFRQNMEKRTHLGWDLSVLRPVRRPKRITTLCRRRVISSRIVGRSPSCPLCLSQLKTVDRQLRSKLGL